MRLFALVTLSTVSYQKEGCLLAFMVFFFVNRCNVTSYRDFYFFIRTVVSHPIVGWLKMVILTLYLKFVANLK